MCCWVKSRQTLELCSEIRSGEASRPGWSLTQARGNDVVKSTREGVPATEASYSIPRHDRVRPEACGLADMKNSPCSG